VQYQHAFRNRAIAVICSLIAIGVFVWMGLPSKQNPEGRRRIRKTLPDNAFTDPSVAKTIGSHHSSTWLAQHADVVVSGKVQGVAARWENGKIVTDVSLHVRDRLKGVVDDDMLFTHEGGSVDHVAMYVHGAPHFDAEENVVVFLAAGSAGHRLIGRSDGKMSAQADDQGGLHVHWLCPTCTSPSTTPLADLAKHVANVGGRRPGGTP
jgi:hypothetical protein